MKTAFVLSGGGANGDFEVGVLQQLTEKGIKPDALYGTSTGALNAAGYSFAGMAGLLATWQSIKGFSDIFGSKNWFSLVLDLLFGKGKGIYTTAPLMGLVKKMVVGNPKIPVTITMVNMRTGALEFVGAAPFSMKNGPITFQESVVASATTPVLNDLFNGVWADGGLRDIAPLRKAIDEGADNIYLILASPFTENQPFDTDPGNVVDTLQKTLGTLVHQIFWSDVNTCIHKNNDPAKKKISLTVYAPLTPLPDPSNFDPAVIQAGIELGYKATPVIQIS